MATGNAATIGDATTSAGADALLASLAEMTVVPDSLRDEYSRAWADPNALDPSVIVARVLTSPIVLRRPMTPTIAWWPQLDLSALSCRLERLRNGTARERLIALATDARARGLLLRRAHSMNATSRPASLGAGYDRALGRVAEQILDGLGMQGIGVAPAQLAGCR
jgi:hypothetical protein